MEKDKTKDESRREFLIKAGKLAVYTPPALMLLMHPSRTTACTSAGGKRPDTQWVDKQTFRDHRTQFASNDFKFGGFKSKTGQDGPKFGGNRGKSGRHGFRS